MSSEVTIYSAGMLISSAQEMSGKELGSDYIMYISSGGTAADTAVNNGGYLNVSSGGTANLTTVNDNGHLVVSSGGTAAGIVNNGGWVDLFDGAANGITVSSGAYLWVYSGGAAAMPLSITVTGTEVLAGTLGLGLLSGSIMAIKIGKSGGYRVDHYYPGDHDPIHVHIRGDDIHNGHGIRVGLDGNPLPGEPSLPPGARRALRKLWEKILKALAPWMG